jgi:hypothetical protein
VELFMAVKGEPALFVRPPEQEPTEDAGIISYRRWLAKSQHPGGVIAQLVDTLKDRPEYVRATVLRNGYLYAEDTALGDALVRYLRADVLFGTPEIWIERGETIVHAARDAKKKRSAPTASRGNG